MRTVKCVLHSTISLVCGPIVSVCVALHAGRLLLRRLLELFCLHKYVCINYYLAIRGQSMSLLAEGTTFVTSHRSALLHNISACMMLYNVVVSALGPRGLSKLIVKPDGKVLVSNSGISILQNLDIAQHPVAKLISDIASSQDKEGDGIISFVVLTGELLRTVEILAGTMQRGLRRVTQEVYKQLDLLVIPLVAHSKLELLSVLENLARVTIATKFAQSWGGHLAHLAADSVVNLSDPNSEELKVMRLPGGNVEDSISVAGVLVEGEILSPPARSSAPLIALLDFPIHSSRNVFTNISSSNTEYQPSKKNGNLKTLISHLSKSGVTVVFATQNCTAEAIYFVQKGIGVVHNVSVADMRMLASSAGCQILHDPTVVFSDLPPTPTNADSAKSNNNNEKDKGEVSGTPMFGRVETVEVAEGSNRFVLVRNKDGTAVGPRTILLRGGSGEVLAEASRGLNEAIAVVKCALRNSKRLQPPVVPSNVGESLSPHFVGESRSSGDLFVPCTVGVVLGGGCVEMALACRLRNVCRDVNVIPASNALANALEGFVRQLATNTGKTVAGTVEQLRVAHRKDINSPLGVDSSTGSICDIFQIPHRKDIKAKKIYMPHQVMHSVLANAIQAVETILRIDSIFKCALAKAPDQLPFS